MERLRRRIQIAASILGNSYWLFFWRSPIYQGALKKLCFPGLNCYSCPAAVTSCPLGALQNALASARFSISAGQVQVGLYVAGLIALIGSVAGRAPCGWLCPFGLIQELVAKLPVNKRELWRPLRWLRFAMLAVMVVALPLLIVDAAGYGQTWFCKFVCPAGTLEAGIPLLALLPDLRGMVGLLFAWKLFLLVMIAVGCIFITRFFCRAICPLGALFGSFNRVSWLRLEFKERNCVRCRACYTVCPVDLSFFDGRDDINSTSCIRCLRCFAACPASAVCVHFGPGSPDGGEEIVGVCPASKLKGRGVVR